ncbi:NAD(P)/FAD-dependent oxidoreductase [Roseibium sediminicola]|uniref:FAD-binding oxidoreductase n=1 Tax=Roseibium sediminicola TaxID=2933272 RepID=A0ABT0GN48_9HYPH|nr:FAD-binding oxidoreductase [Roseibium sp. CAU 1639]MCK7610848.1 FAD-binding oxidoreductase [Roseibium sp. CAU 1639]
MIETSDFLVIGGGIAGAGAAARLAPDASVTVLEMEDALGRHATGRSAAIFIRNYGNRTLRALNAVSEPVLENPDGIAEDSLLSPRGEMLIATEDELDAFESYLNGAEGMETLTADEAVDLFPLLRKEGIAAAAIERDARDIDVDRLLQGFARLAKRHGTQFVMDAPAERISRSSGIWRVETPKGAFEAPVLINAAGAWADQVAALARVKKVGLVPMRRSAAIVPAPEGVDITGWPLVASASESWYAKPDAGKFMVSPADEDPVEPHDAWADDMVLAEGLHRFEQAVTMPVTRVERNWAGLRSFVSDRTPVVGFAPDAEGFFWLAGQGGYGVQTAPALSRLVADLCLKRPSELTGEVVAALDPARLF